MRSEMTWSWSVVDSLVTFSGHNFSDFLQICTDLRIVRDPQSESTTQFGSCSDQAVLTNQRIKRNRSSFHAEFYRKRASCSKSLSEKTQIVSTRKIQGEREIRGVRAEMTWSWSVVDSLVTFSGHQFPFNQVRKISIIRFASFTLKNIAVFNRGWDSWIVHVVKYSDLCHRPALRDPVPVLKRMKVAMNIF